MRAIPFFLIGFCFLLGYLVKNDLRSGLTCLAASMVVVFFATIFSEYPLISLIFLLGLIIFMLWFLVGGTAILYGAGIVAVIAGMISFGVWLSKN